MTLTSSSSFITDVGPTLDNPEFLNSITHSGVPEHELKLKPNTVCTLMRNISAKDGLMNNCKVIVQRIQGRCLSVKAVNTGKVFALPRITFRFKIPSSDIEVERRQFPVRLAYAMTIHRSQGQTLDRIVVDLRQAAFAHGQLYVALTRARKMKDIRILISDEQRRENFKTTNIVYNEVL